MKKEEIYLYLKTLIFNFIFGSLLMIPALAVSGFVAYYFFGVDIFFDAGSMIYNWKFYSIFGAVSLPMIILLNFLTAEYFYKKSVGFDRKEVVKRYVYIGIILDLIYFISDYSNVNYANFFFTIINIAIFVVIFRNINNNNGKFNYKKLF